MRPPTVRTTPDAAVWPMGIPGRLGTLALVAATCLYAATIVSAAAQAPARTVSDGIYSTTLAERGKAQYAASCARCHGGSLEGGMGRSLVGTSFWNKWREQSVGDLLDYVSRNMPMGQTSTTTLSPPVYADIVAFLLNSNDLPAGERDLSATSGIDAHIVPKEGSTGELPATTLARVVGCLGPQTPDRSWPLSAASRPERMKTIDPPSPGASAGAAGAPVPPQGGDRQYALKFVLQPLAPLVGQRVAVVGILIGDGGADGINVSTVTALGQTCN
jgi:mono/diheme cytochrome c family protein